MNYQIAGLTDPGQVRSNNEDAIAWDDTHGVLVLADGMGGYNAGEVASGMATTFIQSELVRWLSVTGNHPKPAAVARALEVCAEKANHSILQASISNPQYAGMGTTLVVAVFQDQNLVLGHVGDSRCYRWRANTLEQLTKDHSMLQEQVDAGLMTAEEAATAPGKNLLTRALGVDDVSPIDTQIQRVEAGDLYLLCSDGLTDMLGDAALAAVLGGPGDLSAKAQTLVAQANANGGRDNIAVLLCQATAHVGRMARWFGRTG